jgi:hypothetical protein
MKKAHKDIVGLNTLAHAKAVIFEDLTKGHHRPSEFATQEEIETYLKEQFFHHTNLGDFSYDPTKGEIILSIKPELEVTRALPDERMISTVVQEFFTNQGWESVVLIPGRTGIHNTLIRLCHPTLQASELYQQGSRVERAIDSSLARQS